MIDSPPARVIAALPGTLADLVAFTGYPAATVLRLIAGLRSGGLRVNARPETPTVFELQTKVDNSAQMKENSPHAT